MQCWVDHNFLKSSLGRVQTNYTHIHSNDGHAYYRHTYQHHSMIY